MHFRSHRDMEQVTSEHPVSFGYWGPPNTVLTLAGRHRVKCGLDVYPGEVPGTPQGGAE